MCVASPSAAQELLQNRSFEAPVAPADGNNFYLTIPNWAITGTNALPANVIRQFPGYSGNPTATPAGGGSQYFDVNSSAGPVRQTITIPSTGMVDFSAWFSVRDNQQALSGLTVNLYNSAAVLIGSASTNFAAADPIGLWKQAATNNVPVAAGSYVLELVLADPSNVDLASLVFKPAPTFTKSSAPFSDPVNGTANPKLIPGAVAEYTIAVASPPTYAMTANSVRVADPTPAGMDLRVVDIGATGSGPAAFAQGTPSSTLTYNFGGLASTSDNIEFSNNGGATWNYVPTANANGVDPAVTNVRVAPQGTMVAGSGFSLRLRYQIR